MVIPDLFDEVYAHLVDFWREKIEKADDMGYIQREKEVKAQLNEKLDDATKEIAKLYGVTMINREEHIYYEICRHLFFFALKAGIDFQKALEEE